MEYYRLEYNENQNLFHFDGGEHQPNTHGWVTIAEREEETKVIRFCAIVEANHLGKQKFTSAELVTMLWRLYNEACKFN